MPRVRIVAAGQEMPEAQINGMNFFIQGVEGSQ